MPTISTPNYKVDIDKGFAEFNKYLNKLNPSKVFILVDENTKLHCLPLLDEALDMPYELLEVPSGEKNKSIESSMALWEALVSRQCDRAGVMINLGGGVIGDMGGFVASTYMRGIRFIQMPTTLLSQVDASIGGKLGVNFKGFKNALGLFHDPVKVWIHTPFIKTLDERQRLSGFAEVIKHGLIQSKSLWGTIKIKGIELTDSQWSSVIADSVRIKNKVVSEDPKEAGLRKILNFGHTIGHAIESFFLHSETPLLHGEAIAKGMITEAYLSFKTKRISIIELEEINSLLESIYKLPTINKEDMPKLIDLMQMDKKNKDGKKLFSLINTIGGCDYDVEIDDEMILESLQF